MKGSGEQALTKIEKWMMVVMHLEMAAGFSAVWEMARAVEQTSAEEEMAGEYWLPLFRS